MTSVTSDSFLKSLICNIHEYICKLNVNQWELWTLSYTVIYLIVSKILLESYNFQRQVGSKSTPNFAYALIVDSRELAETERLHRGLGF